MMSLWILLDAIDRIINLAPKLVAQFVRDLCIQGGDLACILGCTWMDNKWLHAANLSPAKSAELILGHACNGSTVHLRRSIIDFCISNPVVGVVEAPKQQNGQLSPLRLGKADDSFSYFGERTHGTKVPCAAQNASPIFCPQSSPGGWHQRMRTWLVVGLRCCGHGVRLGLVVR